MSELLKKIKSRGHWRVVIRPNRFVEKRVNGLAELKDILQKTSVHLRVWDFPHIGAMNGHQNAGADWVGQEHQSDYFLELWRFYQSGQFIYYSALVTDWSDHGYSTNKNNAKGLMILKMPDVVHRFIEIFEFAARLALSEAGDEIMHIEIAFGGIEGRDVVIEPVKGMPIPVTPVDFQFKRNLIRAELIANPRELALDTTARFFHQLGWNPNREVLREIQSNLKR